MCKLSFKLIVLLVSVSVLLIVGGCATKVQEVENEPAASTTIPEENREVVTNVDEVEHKATTSSDANLGKNVYFEISESGGYASSKSYQPTVDKLKAKIKEKLLTQDASYTFPNGEPTSDGLLVKIDIQNFRYVSGGARFWGGIMAGKAKLTMLVMLNSLKENEVLNEFTLGSESSYAAGIFGATTKRQIDAMSDRIVAKVLEL